MYTRPYPDELYHYGRKGMKWGQHIYGKESRSSKKKLKKTDGDRVFKEMDELSRKESYKKFRADLRKKKDAKYQEIVDFEDAHEHELFDLDDAKAWRKYDKLWSEWYDIKDALKDKTLSELNYETTELGKDFIKYYYEQNY